MNNPPVRARATLQPESSAAKKVLLQIQDNVFKTTDKRKKIERINIEIL